jgi:UrcA family protein
MRELMTMLKLALGALAVLAITPAAGAATQQNPFAKESVVLNLRHIDLATVEGQRTLAIRVDHAARDVCGDRLDTIHLALEAQARSCRAAVTADVRAQIEAKTADAGTSPRPMQLALR